MGKQVREDVVSSLIYPPGESQRIWVGFVGASGTYSLYKHDPHSTVWFDLLARSMKREEPIEYTYALDPRGPLRLTSVAQPLLPSRPSVEPTWASSFDLDPTQDRTMAAYEGRVRAVAPRDRFWVFFDDAARDRPYHHLRWDAPESRASFDVLVECMWKQSPVRVTFFTASGEVLRVESRQK
jgi:hypothetical protein